MLEKIKQLLGLGDSEEKDAILSTIMEVVESQILLRTQETAVPQVLQFIVVEVTVARYNRLGSEGLQSEKIDVISNTYISDLMAPYYATIEEYNRKHRGSRKVVFV